MHASRFENVPERIALGILERSTRLPADRKAVPTHPSVLTGIERPWLTVSMFQPGQFGAASSPAFENTEILTEEVSVCTEECFVIHTIPVGLS